VALVIVFKNATLKMSTRYLGLGVTVTILMITRVYELPKFYEYSIYDQIVMRTAKQIKADPDVICSNLNGRFAVSNYAFVYRILCAAPVRHIYPSFQQNNFLDESLEDWAVLGAKQGIVVSLFPYKGDKESYLPLKEDVVMKLNALGWQVERNEKENLILSRKANSSL
jgi:hypothetical protein